MQNNIHKLFKELSQTKPRPNRNQATQVFHRFSRDCSLPLKYLCYVTCPWKCSMLSFSKYFYNNKMLRSLFQAYFTWRYTAIANKVLSPIPLRVCIPYHYGFLLTAYIFSGIVSQMMTIEKVSTTLCGIVSWMVVSVKNWVETPSRRRASVSQLFLYNNIFCYK